MENLEKAYLSYTNKPETPVTGECQKVDGRGWEDTKVEATASASLYVESVSKTATTEYFDCD